MIITSYYTRNTHYEREADDLIASCETFSLPYDIVATENRGTWEKNCAYKPTFLLEMLEKHQTPIIWIDIDAVIVAPPTLFSTLTCDIAAAIQPHLPPDHPSKLLTGTLFINNTQNAHTVLTTWAKKTADEEWDQVALRKTLETTPTHFTPLPETYTAIVGKEPKSPVIVHYQASRHYKKLINLEVSPLFGDHEWNAKDFAAHLPLEGEAAAEDQRGKAPSHPSET